MQVALLSVVRVKSRRESAAASAAVKDLLLTNLLPPHRKLLTFEAHAPEVAVILRSLEPPAGGAPRGGKGGGGAPARQHPWNQAALIKPL